MLVRLLSSSSPSAYPSLFTFPYLIHPCFTLLMPIYSLGAWAIDQSSPLDPALRQGDHFLPGVSHLLHFRLDVSPPGVSWPSAFPLLLRIPCQGLSGDASVNCNWVTILFSFMWLRSVERFHHASSFPTPNLHNLRLIGVIWV